MSMMHARQTLARTERHVQMMSMDSNVSVHQATPASIAMKISLTAKKTLAHLVLLALI